MANAGDRPPRYGNIETRGLSYRGGIETRGLSYGIASGGRANGFMKPLY